MSNFDCSCRYNCTDLAIVASVLVGLIAGILTFSAIITITPAFLGVLLGIGVVYLAITLITAPFLRIRGAQYCICRIIPILLTGILGTILTSIILLGVTFAAASVLGAIISGLLLAFFTLIVTTVACLVRCITGCSLDSSNDL